MGTEGLFHVENLKLVPYSGNQVNAVLHIQIIPEPRRPLPSWISRKAKASEPHSFASLHRHRCCGLKSIPSANPIEARKCGNLAIEDEVPLVDTRLVDNDHRDWNRIPSGMLFEGRVWPRDCIRRTNRRHFLR